MKNTADSLPATGLTGSMRDFRVIAGDNIISRVEEFYAWQDTRRTSGLWPFSRATEGGAGAVCSARDDRGSVMRGVNFASQDYLSLSSHPDVIETAKKTIDEAGVHSAGSPALVGNTSHSIALEQKIGAFLGMQEVTLFPTGWAAGYGVIKGLVRSADHIVMDHLAHACLQEGAAAATKNVHRFRHLDMEQCRQWLHTIRSQDTTNAIMVLTEGLFSMDSDTPDIGAMQALCHEYNATLVVDVAHDLGSLGPNGRGHIGAQNMIGQVDLVMGSFSKTFGSNGGFVASKTRAVKEYLKFFSPPQTFSNALSPVQAAVVLKAFEIVDSAEGDSLRRKLMKNVMHLRQGLESVGLQVYGAPSPIVAVKMGSEGLARLVSRQIAETGLLANLVEFPAVAKGAARFRLQVMAGHSTQNVEDAVHILRRAFDEASLLLAPEFLPKQVVRSI